MANNGDVLQRDAEAPAGFREILFGARRSRRPGALFDQTTSRRLAASAYPRILRSHAWRGAPTSG